VASLGYPIAAVSHETPSEPRGPWVVPGRYTAILTVDGRTYRAPLRVRMDPRVATPRAGLALQLALAQRIVTGVRQDSAALSEVRVVRARLAEVRGRAGADSLRPAIDSLAGDLARLEAGSGSSERGLARLADDLAGLYDVIEGTDAAPTTQAQGALTHIERGLAGALDRWRTVQGAGVAALGRRLHQAGLPSFDK
jgi:hypothetical protein